MLGFIKFLENRKESFSKDDVKVQFTCPEKRFGESFLLDCLSVENNFRSFKGTVSDSWWQPRGWFHKKAIYFTVEHFEEVIFELFFTFMVFRTARENLEFQRNILEMFSKLGLTSPEDHMKEKHFRNFLSAFPDVGVKFEQRYQNCIPGHHSAFGREIFISRSNSVSLKELGLGVENFLFKKSFHAHRGFLEEFQIFE